MNFVAPLESLVTTMAALSLLIQKIKECSSFPQCLNFCGRLKFVLHLTTFWLPTWMKRTVLRMLHCSTVSLIYFYTCKNFFKFLYFSYRWAISGVGGNFSWFKGSHQPSQNVRSNILMTETQLPHWVTKLEKLKLKDWTSLNILLKF